MGISPTRVQDSAAIRLTKQFWDPAFDRDSLSDTAVLEWVSSAEAITNGRYALTPELEPDWTLRENYVSLVRMTARLLTNFPNLSQDVLMDVNRVANMRPQIFRAGECSYTFDLFSSRIGAWEQDLAELKNRKQLRVLEIGSFEGLASVWLLKNVLTDKTGRLVSIDRYENDAGPTLLYKRNVTAVGGLEQVSTHRGNLRDLVMSLSDQFFDFIYIDSLFETTEFIELPDLSWNLLKRGGIMSIDDCHLRDHPIYNIIQPTCDPQVGIGHFLQRYGNEISIIRDTYELTVRKL